MGPFAESSVSCAATTPSIVAVTSSVAKRNPSCEKSSESIPTTRFVVGSFGLSFDSFDSPGGEDGWGLSVLAAPLSLEDEEQAAIPRERKKRMSARRIDRAQSTRRANT